MRNLGDSVLPSSLALLVVNLCVVGRSPWCQNGTIPHNIGWTTWKKRPKIKFYKGHFQTDSKFGTYSGLFLIQEIPSLRTKLAYMRLEDSWSMAHIHLKKSWKNEAKRGQTYKEFSHTYRHMVRLSKLAISESQHCMHMAPSFCPMYSMSFHTFFKFWWYWKYSIVGFWDEEHEKFQNFAKFSRDDLFCFDGKSCVILSPRILY